MVLCLLHQKAIATPENKDTHRVEKVSFLFCYCLFCLLFGMCKMILTSLICAKTQHAYWWEDYHHPDKIKSFQKRASNDGLLFWHSQGFLFVLATPASTTETNACQHLHWKFIPGLYNSAGKFALNSRATQKTFIESPFYFLVFLH